MSEDAPPNPGYDASRVMLNGAAIALVSSLVNGMETRLREEIRAVEERQTAELDKVVRVFAPDIKGLEMWQRSVTDAALRRDGQLSVLQAAGSFLVRYDKVILGIGIGIATGVAAAVFGVGS